MKPLTQKDLDDLARYIDDELGLIERQAFEQRLATNTLLQERFAALLDVHQMMKAQPLQTPSKNFTLRVMENLDHYSPPAFSFSIRNGIFLLAGVLLAGVLAMYLAGSGAFDGPVTISSPVDLSLSQKIFNRSLPTVSFDGKVLVNAIVLLNLALGWLVLDRTILRPWFRRRLVHN
jgi:anti-sigma factor RsiW